MSSTSLPFRLELRPSRWLTGALLSLAGLIPVAVLVSEMPRILAWPLAVVGALYALRIAFRERCKSTQQLVINASGQLLIEDVAIEDFEIEWRGPLAFLRWRTRDGRMRHWSLWPDTLPSQRRRELRLAVLERAAVRQRLTMAR